VASTAVFTNTRGSLLAVLAYHASGDTAGFFVNLTPRSYDINVAITVVVATLLVVLLGPRHLSRSADKATSNFGVQEMVFFSEQQQEAMAGGPTFQDGYLHIRDVPGLGTDVDEAAAAKYHYQRGYLPVTRRLDGSVHDW
jgi:hypothetical protein